jgi:hypothetical protein
MMFTSTSAGTETRVEKEKGILRLADDPGEIVQQTAGRRNQAQPGPKKEQRDEGLDKNLARPPGRQPVLFVWPVPPSAFFVLLDTARVISRMSPY